MNIVDTRIVRPIPLLLRPLILSLQQQFKETGLLLGEIKGSASVSQWGRVCWQKLRHGQPWGLHDCRRSLATKMNDMGMAIYNRSQYCFIHSTLLGGYNQPKTPPQAV
ncbi:hypothetical protein HGT73_00010 [Rosenbergiella australiborealis]|uniref:Uncharacterized protein n=1 Tax=Rosenbergiella australiborealis TaxID=1544696 RepID=A0ABS5T2Y5_9GAMM|nr:hypothetical protein [Rosenbergiella australiborealis]MBT0725792.1 hypothetical protein [Rosenbergiella australiborealis]